MSTSSAKHRSRTRPYAWDSNVHYQGTWPYGAREKHTLAIKERLKEIERERALKALNAWRGLNER